MAGLPPVFVEFLGKSTGVKTALADIKAETRVAAAEGETSFSQFGRISKAAVAGIGIAAVAAAADTVHMAADFQTQMTRVKTGAGEAASNMKLVSDGVLSMAGQVGESTTELTSGLYTVESAGYHGSDALNVLKNSAEGAKVGAADLATVTDAVTTGLNAYHMGASQASDVTNELIATEAEGKTNMEALAGSMASILPTASAAHVGIQEVLGAMATMTAQGTPAAVAATYLRQTIGMLSNPSAKAAAEMKDLGLNSVQVAQNLGKNGLASTLTELTTAITQHMGPAGTVLIKHLQDAAKNTSAYQKVLAGLPPSQQTYIGALATMVGGTKSMQAALELTGPHMKTFQADTAGIAQHVKDAHGGIEGWSDVQKTFNQRMAEAKAGVGAMAIQIGNALLPTVTKLAGVLATVVTFLTKHKAIAEALAIVIGGILVVSIAVLTVALWNAAAASAALTWPIILIALAVAALIAIIVLLIMHWRTVWAVIKDVGLAIAHAVMAAWDAVVAFTESAWKHISQAVSEAWNAVAAFFVGAWHAVVDPIVHAWDIVSKAVSDAWDGIVSFLVGAWHTVVDPIVSAWNSIVSVTTTVWNAVLGFLRKWWPLLLVLFLPFVALAIAIWNHFHTAIFNTAIMVWNKVSGFFVGVWNFIASTAKTAWGLIQSYIVAPVVAVWQWLVSAWNTIYGWLVTLWGLVAAGAKIAWNAIKVAIIDPIIAMWNQIVSVWHTIAGWLTTAWHGIAAAASAVWNAIKTAIISPLTSAWHSITGIVGKIGSAIGTGLQSAWNTVSNIGSKFLSIGSDIINGIITGIENAAGSLFSALGKIASNALSSAKSFLGIGSPSKEFAEQVGQWIPHGIAQGITKYSGVAHAAVKNLTGQLTSQSLGVGTAGLGVAGGAAAGGIGGAAATAQVTTIVQVDGEELFRATQPHALRFDRRNAQAGLVYVRG
jgi:TP901 family phage tail tape measure protein